MLKQKSNDKTKTKKTEHNESVFMDSYKIQGPALTEGKRRGRKAQVDAAVIGNIRQTLSDEEGVLGVEMHHLLGWGRSARSEAAGRAGRFLLLELLLWAIHAKIWIGLLMLLTCELRSLHSFVGGDAGDYWYRRRALLEERQPAIVVPLRRRCLGRFETFRVSSFV